MIAPWIQEVLADGGAERGDKAPGPTVPLCRQADLQVALVGLRGQSCCPETPTAVLGSSLHLVALAQGTTADLEKKALSLGAAALLGGRALRGGDDAEDVRGQEVIGEEKEVAGHVQGHDQTETPTIEGLGWRRRREA